MGVSWGLMLVFWRVKGAQWRLNLIVVGCGYIIIVEGSLEAKLPIIWTDGKAEVGRGREERRGEEKRREEKESEERRCRCGKGLKSCEGLCFCSLKRRVRSHLARWEMKTCTPLWHEAHLEVKMCKTHHSWTAFGSWDVEKVARHCGTKHTSKSKCAKHTNVGALLEVDMSKKCPPLWREAHFEVKMYKAH